MSEPNYLPVSEVMGAILGSREPVNDDAPNSLREHDCAGDDKQIGAEAHRFEADRNARGLGRVANEAVSEIDGDGASVGVVSVGDDEGFEAGEPLVPDPEVSKAKRDQLIRARGLAYPEMRKRREVELGILIQIFEDIQETVHCGLVSASLDLSALYPAVLEDLAQALRGGRTNPFEVADRLDKIAADTRKNSESVFRYGQISQTAVQTGLQLVRYGLTHDAHTSEEDHK